MIKLGKKLKPHTGIGGLQESFNVETVTAIFKLLGGLNTLSVDISGELPAGLINGSNVDFSTAFNFLPGSLKVFVNGVRQIKDMDYTETGVNSFQFVEAPVNAPMGDLLLVDYKKEIG